MDRGSGSGGPGGTGSLIILFGGSAPPKKNCFYNIGFYTTCSVKLPFAVNFELCVKISSWSLNMYLLSFFPKNFTEDISN